MLIFLVQCLSFHKINFLRRHKFAITMTEGYDGEKPPAYDTAPSAPSDPADPPGATNGARSTKSTPELDRFFNRNSNLPLALKHNLISLGVSSLDTLLKMDDSQILMYGNLDKFDSSLSTDLIFLVGALKQHKLEQAKINSRDNDYKRFKSPLAFGDKYNGNRNSNSNVPLSTDPGPG